MKKNLLLLFLTILSFNCYSQISFEKGYYIDNDGQKMDCLIKNMDWKNNPTEIEYKLSANDESMIANISSVKEFGINNASKYIRKTVKIDKDIDNVKDLTEDKNPIFTEEELFLKVLVEGSANLYFYQNGNLKRYFYNVDNSNVEQLVFKRYMIDKYKVAENNQFRQQLWNGFNCPNFQKKSIENLKYKTGELSNLFIEYNQCNNSGLTNLEKAKSKNLFNITLRPRFNSSSLVINNTGANGSEINLGNKSGFGFGIEAEYIFPFNNNKWSISLEPTFQSYKNSKTFEVSYVADRKLTAEIDYKSIEFPITFRHYLYLNDASKLFLNVSYVFDMNVNSTIDLVRSDNNIYESLEVKTTNNFAFGIGYKYDDKYSLEFRYFTKRELLNSYSLWPSDYQTFSVILGYSIL